LVTASASMAQAATGIPTAAGFARIIDPSVRSLGAIRTEIKSGTPVNRRT
jgi:hypothetical protein